MRRLSGGFRPRQNPRRNSSRSVRRNFRDNSGRTGRGWGGGEATVGIVPRGKGEAVIYIVGDGQRPRPTFLLVGNKLPTPPSSRELGDMAAATHLIVCQSAHVRGHTGKTWTYIGHFYDYYIRASMCQLRYPVIWLADIQLGNFPSCSRDGPPPLPFFGPPPSPSESPPTRSTRLQVPSATSVY